MRAAQTTHPGSRIPLPIDAHLDAIGHAVRQRQAVILVAPPGSGKTTRVPPTLVARGPVVLLQPRRIAARSIARRIATEQGWALGEEIGWHVRFERRVSARTRLVVATEGILTARLVEDPLLSSFATVVLDEFHERSQHADLALALVRQAMRAREDLRLVVMSATLDPDPLVRYLDDAAVIDVPGRSHPIEIRHAPHVSPASACRDVLSRAGRHVLCFLPGMEAMRRTARELEAVGLPRETGLLMLHGSMGPDEQDSALAPCAQRKLILCTNVAETSLTVDEVTDVVDSGLHKVMRFDAARGLDRLDTERISRASAEQRAGRAGRTGPGMAVRLWDPRDILAEGVEPELVRIDLARPLLDLVAAGEDPERFEWLDPPPAPRVSAALGLLERLGFVEGRRLTRIGGLARKLPLHPRLAAVVVAANGAPRAVRACAILAEGLRDDAVGPACDSDLAWRLDAFERLPRSVREAARQIENLLRAVRWPGESPASDDDEALMRGVLAGYADRVAQRRAPGSRRLLLCSGIGARLADRSSVHTGTYLVALDVAAGGDRGGDEALVRQASLVHGAWLQPTHAETVHALDDTAGTVRAEAQERYGALILSRHAVAPDPDKARELLASALGARGLGEQGERWLRRAACAGVALDRGELIERACAGRLALHEIDIAAAIPWEARRRIAEVCPAELAVPSGRKLDLDYRADGRVHLAVKLQELFGCERTPVVGTPPQPVVIELLAPNGRPVQTTTDLRSFWDRTYPEVRKELRGRYPKHPWPDDPWTATPTSRTRRRTG